ncbi:Zinc metalloproteinase-disintegrin-like ohanin [Chionoecetes opilio]|uniref:Zinc metalloproteinase-disintegrin-like ohanin n=1 Tax=Chionoecetes opilio TaxID=41210 RepID=A0A8J5CG57_CHIOP|nr:Zinc metalloproteinase-disintegrin-like ohanin [Chionoecetes opilio]
MTPRVTWDSLSGVVCRSIAAMGEAGAPGREGWTPLHDRGSPRERRVSPGRVCLPGSPGPACITLVLLLCALVQLAAASLQLPASSSATTRVLHHSEALTQHVSLTNTTLPVPHDASTTQGISGAGEPRHHPAVVKSRRRNQSRHSSGQIVPAAAMTTSAARAPPPRRPERQAPHNPARATRAITAVRRVELHGPPLTHRQTLYVEVVVLADHTFYRHHGTRQKRPSTRGSHHGRRQQGKSNYTAPSSPRLSSFFHTSTVTDSQFHSHSQPVLGGVGVVLVPADVQVLNRRDQMPTASNLDTTVERLQRHRLELLTQYPDQPNDHTLLLTRKQMRRRGSCGAPLQGMCRTKQSVSVVQDEGEGPGVTGAALAHQVGHSLGMQDDAKDADPACPCDAATCVMSRHSRLVCRHGPEW